MEFKEFKDLLFSKAKKEGFAECEIYFSDRENLSISVYNEEVEKYNLNKTFGLSFRGKINEKMGYSYTEILDDDAIDMLIKNAKEGASAIESEDVQFIYDGDKEYSEVRTYSKDLENIDAEKLIQIALDMEKEAKKESDKVVNIGACSVGYGNSYYGIYNTKGLELTNKVNLLTAYVVPIIEVDGEKYDGTGYVTANSIEEVDAKKIAKEGVEEALARVNGKSLESGKYKTIINNEAMVSLLSAFSGVFDGDAAQKGLSLLKGKEGETIASDILTIVDNPLLDNGLASTPFDDEGVATFKKEVISKGKLVTLLHNLKTANKAGIKTTGNGFKGSYASTVGISPTNFYIEKGSDTLEELIKYLGEGLIVTEFAGLHSGANMVTGDFSLAAKGFYIEGGKKSYPVEQITVAGNYFELLKSIEKIGNDLKFPMSSVGSPSVIIKELSVAGE
ncbi:TldD/PmbA family protein [Clostridium cibarium]|uniref:TldD/PmbA family protein n=1 Tax=Clostridium cibarium TaxID=2762247 RepID=A0ABR8PWR1_9CLOT|nr:TldD/PmbA family protein [Clostridium cibarium]MBD7912600.1 TldD/PmbA family protein [Clostridium cibarium]